MPGMRPTAPAEAASPSLPRPSRPGMATIRALLPYLGVLLAVLALVIAFPALVLRGSA